MGNSKHDYKWVNKCSVLNRSDATISLSQLDNTLFEAEQTSNQSKAMYLSVKMLSLNLEQITMGSLLFCLSLNEFPLTQPISCVHTKWNRATVLEKKTHIT